MKKLSILGPIAVLAFTLIGVTGCSSGGSQGCGGPSESELDQQAQGATNRPTTTCGPGTHLEGTVCQRNVTTTSSSQQTTSLGN